MPTQCIVDGCLFPKRESIDRVWEKRPGGRRWIAVETRERKGKKGKGKKGKGVMHPVLQFARAEVGKVAAFYKSTPTR